MYNIKQWYETIKIKELQIRRGNRNHSAILFLFLNENICCRDPPPSEFLQKTVLMRGHNIHFLGEKKEIIHKLSLLPLLISNIAKNHLSLSPNLLDRIRQWYQTAVYETIRLTLLGTIYGSGTILLCIRTISLSTSPSITSTALFGINVAPFICSDLSTASIMETDLSLINSTTHG